MLETATSAVPRVATVSKASITWTVPSRSTSRIVRADAVEAETPAVCTTATTRPSPAAVSASFSTAVRSETSVRTPCAA
jgi:hypothetical protein